MKKGNRRRRPDRTRNCWPTAWPSGKPLWTYKVLENPAWPKRRRLFILAPTTEKSLAMASARRYFSWLERTTRPQRGSTARLRLHGSLELAIWRSVGGLSVGHHRKSRDRGAIPCRTR